MTSVDNRGKVMIRRDHDADARERQVYVRIDDAPDLLPKVGPRIM